MDIWFRKNLGEAMLAFQALEDVQTVCLSAYNDADCRKETAVLFRHESEGRLQCEVIVCFSPVMADIAGELGLFGIRINVKYRFCKMNLITRK